MAVEIPQLNSCCCGCSLKTGTKIIGWLELICSILIFGTMWISLAALSAVQDNPDSIPDPKTREELLKIIPIVKILLIILIITSLISCILAFVLLLGVYQQKANLVMIWIVATLTITLISGCINMIQVIAYGDRYFLSHALTFLLNVYYLLVVHSYYRETTNSPGYA